MEGIAERYWEMLEKADNPVQVLLGFYTNLLDVTPSPKIAKTLGRLVKIYGRVPTFFSIISIAGSSNIDYDNPPFGLLTYHIQRKMTNKENTHSEDLSSLAEKINKEIEQVRKENNA